MRASTQTGPVAWGSSCKDGVGMDEVLCTGYWVPRDRGPVQVWWAVMGSMARA